jgi:hypothetical protein
MADLDFAVTGVDVVPYAASPQLAFHLRVDAGPGTTVYTVALRCQIQIEPGRRQYQPEEQANLRDLFGEPERWSRTLRQLLWTHANVVVPRFMEATMVDLVVPCTFDFNVGATKYFYGVRDGDLPLCFLFSGTVFYEDEGSLQVAPVSWAKESNFRLPIATWRALMDAYYPNSAWLCLQRDAFDKLLAYKVRHGIPTWEQAIDNVLASASDKMPAEVRS